MKTTYNEPDEWHLDAASLDSLLGGVEAFLRHYVCFEDHHQSRALALWAAHTYLKNVIQVTPYLNITSPDKGSGKTRLLEVLAVLVKDPYFTVLVSPAALFRIIDQEHPTVLLDEVDSLRSQQYGFSNEMKGLLNQGYRRNGAKLVRAVRDSKEVLRYDLFCPKAFAGNGSPLPSTVADRSIPIHLYRAGPDEQPAEFDMEQVSEDAEALRRALEQLPNLIDHRSTPVPPHGLIDRAAEVWKSLLQIADTAGGNWPRWAREAAVFLHQARSEDDESLPSRLLADIRQVANSDQWIGSIDLVARLHRLEEAPWADLPPKGLTVSGLARMLRGFGIRPADRHVDSSSRGSVLKGYRLADFGRAFSKYLPREAEGHEPEQEAV
jgi:hypothetical protein